MYIHEERGGEGEVERGRHSIVLSFFVQFSF